MNGWIMAAQLIVGLSILVFVHELGHFLAARMFKIRVDKFYIFFDAWGYKFFSKKIGETEYGIGWLPLGGYVKIAGMIDESMDKEQMKQPAQPWEFRSKPAWQRFIVMIGGVTMNIILGIIIYTAWLLYFEEGYVPVSEINKNGIYAYQLAREIGLQTGDKIIAVNGNSVERYKDINNPKVWLSDHLTIIREGKKMSISVPQNLFTKIIKVGKGNFISQENFPFQIDSVVQNTPADSAGLKSNDKIISINGESTLIYGQFRESVQSNAGKQVQLTIARNGDTINLNSRVNEDGTLGVVTIFNRNSEIVKYSIPNAIKYGVKDAFGELIYGTIIPFGKIFKGEIKPGESLQGPIGIAKIYGSTWDWKRFWYITALISMVLAFMNLLPIPALDGGHVVFILVEMVTRRQVSEKVIEKAQIVGMVILFTLMAYAIGNDIMKMF